uniref:Uncharacterized protein n=1 Tax=viral metagenome TaxID=1070528 RepID=A0A2V0RL69_9ZZZZ
MLLVDLLNRVINDAFSAGIADVLTVLEGQFFTVDDVTTDDIELFGRAILGSAARHALLELTTEANRVRTTNDDEVNSKWFSTCFDDVVIAVSKGWKERLDLQFGATPTECVQAMDDYKEIVRRVGTTVPAHPLQIPQPTIGNQDLMDAWCHDHDLPPARPGTCESNLVWIIKQEFSSDITESGVHMWIHKRAELAASIRVAYAEKTADHVKRWTLLLMPIDDGAANLDDYHRGYVTAVSAAVGTQRVEFMEHLRDSLTVPNPTPTPYAPYVPIVLQNDTYNELVRDMTLGFDRTSMFDCIKCRPGGNGLHRLMRLALNPTNIDDIIWCRTTAKTRPLTGYSVIRCVEKRTNSAGRDPLHNVDIRPVYVGGNDLTFGKSQLRYTDLSPGNKVFISVNAGVPEYVPFTVMEVQNVSHKFRNRITRGRLCDVANTLLRGWDVTEFRCHIQTGMLSFSFTGDAKLQVMRPPSPPPMAGGGMGGGRKRNIARTDHEEDYDDAVDDGMMLF